MRRFEPGSLSFYVGTEETYCTTPGTSESAQQQYVFSVSEWVFVGLELCLLKCEAKRRVIARSDEKTVFFSKYRVRGWAYCRVGGSKSTYYRNMI